MYPEYNELNIKNLNDEEKMNCYQINNAIKDFKDNHIRFYQNNTRFIIKKEHKKNIINELETVGYFEAFLFPELNYEGSRIMNDYLTRTK